MILHGISVNGAIIRRDAILKLRKYQREAIDSVINFYNKNDKGHPIIEMPTGSGKALVLAQMIKEFYAAWAGIRILALTHVKELIEQNHQALLYQWESAEHYVGIYHAGLRKKQYNFPIVFAGIQSAYRKPELFGHQDIVFIDEVHLCSEKNDGMYRKFISDLQTINPHLKLIGLTATPYRLSSGCLIGGINPLFTDICYKAKIKTMIDDGYLAPLITITPELQADLTDVKTVRGDFDNKEMESVFIDENLCQLMVFDLIANAESRKSWLIFCSGLTHAELVRDEIRSYDITCEMISGKTPKDEREKIIAQFKAGEIQAVTNNNVMTTGTNIPRLDLIALMRATQSPGLYIQMLGRGMRMHQPLSETYQKYLKDRAVKSMNVYFIVRHDCDVSVVDKQLSAMHQNDDTLITLSRSEYDTSEIESSLVYFDVEPDKKSALVLDYGDNIGRHGPIEDINPPSPKQKTQDSEAPVKTCPECEAVNRAARKECTNCGFEFPPPESPLKTKAEGGDILYGVIGKWNDVNHVRFTEHLSAAGNMSMCITYSIGLTQEVKEWKSFDKGRMFTYPWWQKFFPNYEMPDTLEEGIEAATLFTKEEYHKLKRIFIQKDKSNPRWKKVTGYEFN